MLKKLSAIALMSAVLITAQAAPLSEADRTQALFREAMSNLLGTHGAVKSEKAAFEKFELLARQGWKTAQHMLGNMYFKGEGTERNLIKAYLWYSLAAKQNYLISEEKLLFLRNQMKKSQLEEAELLFTKWSNKATTL